MRAHVATFLLCAVVVGAVAVVGAYALTVALAPLIRALAG